MREPLRSAGSAEAVSPSDAAGDDPSSGPLAPGCETGAEAPRPDRRSPLRPLVLGIPLIIVNGFWTMALWGRAGYATGQSFPTTVSLYYNALSSLLVLIGANALLRRRFPRAALDGSELLVLYVMVTVASSIAGHDMLEIVWPTIAYVTWFGTPENGWGRFQQHIPDWLTLKERAPLRDFFVGGSTLYTREHLALWAVPVLAWSVLLLALGAIMLCLTVLLKERWVRHERLSYPLTQVPLAMTDTRMRLFADPLFWAGAALAGGVDLLNGLHHLYPHIPSLGGALYEHDLRRLVTSRPWSAIGWTPTAIYPFAIGMTFLIPLDLSFSIWFFYLFGKATRVIGDGFGLTGDPSFPYTVEQSAGAWVGLALAALWSSSGFLVRQLRSAWSRPRADDGEYLSPRGALIGLLAASAVVTALCTAAGFPLWATAAFFTLFFAFSLAITRVRAELGPPSHDIESHPLRIMVQGLGAGRVGQPALTLLTMMTAFNRSYRSHPMPCMLEGLAIGSWRQISPRFLVTAMAVALVAGTVTSAWSYFDHAYRFGGAIFGEQGQIRANLTELSAWDRSTAQPRLADLGAMAFGMAGVFALTAGRRLCYWSPFHPAGFALSLGTWNTSWLWFSIFLGWLAKWAVLHAGGLRAYRRGLPFFMGLILGEFAMGAVWSLIGIALGMPMYRFLQ
jgi:hypothetical protein